MVLSKNDPEIRWENMRNTFSKKTMGIEYKNCNAYAISDSPGLLADASIVCKVLHGLKTPMIYFETFPKNATEKDCIFVNIDMTDFKTLARKNSPNTILCKTHQIYNIVKPLFPNKKVIYTGFTSIDSFDPRIRKDYKKFIHVCGKSPFKGTKPLLQAWHSHPLWPTLTIVCKNTMGVVDMCREVLNGDNPSNINLIIGHLDGGTLSKISNESGIHICVSECEGFGHYIHEARSMGAVVLYTNAPSMNERFENGVNGIAVEYVEGPTQNNGYCPMYTVTPQSIEQAVERVLRMDTKTLEEISKNARNSYLADNESFTKKIRSLFYNK
jgi:glycosyltransferase involved in cell wall biosynthesis